MDDPFRSKYTRYGFEKVNDKRFDRMFKHVAYTILCRCYSLLSKKDKVIYTAVDSPGFVFVVANVVDAGCYKIPQKMVWNTDHSAINGSAPTTTHPHRSICPPDF